VAISIVNPPHTHTLTGFVVAASRARLGFFILGSVAAVETNSSGVPVKHWATLLTHLREPRLLTRLGADGAEAGEASGSRVASALPLSCPRHRESVRPVLCSADFPKQKNWGEFCRLPCSYNLGWCGHLCGITCHSPALQPHTTNSDCAHALDRPCPDHSTVPLKCGALFRATVGTQGTPSRPNGDAGCPGKLPLRRKGGVHKAGVRPQSSNHVPRTP
jgi:hypothetical protein